MKHALIAFAIFAALMVTNQASAWDLNDVSILWPLPASSTADGLLTPLDQGAMGQLLPRARFDLLPQLVVRYTPDQVYAALRAVGVRLDPCFARFAGGCQPQIRIVWQPVIYDNNGVARVLDTAVHTFFDLTQAKFDALAKSLKSLDAGVSRSGAPLGVNPVLQQQSYNGKYATALKALILANAGTTNMSRLTFMRVNWNNTVWDFAGWDISASALTPINIPRANVNMQSFKNELTDNGNLDFFGGLQPSLTSADTFNLIVSDSKSVTASVQNEIVNEVISIYRIENPTVYNASNMDCVSCHMAQAARKWAVRKFPNLDFPALGGAFVYSEPALNLTNASLTQDKTNSIRSFGYLGSDMAITQRVINETAVVVDYFNAHY